jgi:plasmid stability protein
MKNLTIRNVTDELHRALQEEQRRRGASLNQTVLDLLRRALGLEAGAPFDNRLDALAGTWTEEEFHAFEEHTAPFGQVDEELWR